MSHENEILDLINSSAGKAAPYMTERLRTIGDGKMSAGVTALTRYAAKYGMEIGEIKSLKKGLGLGGATMMAFDFYRKKKERIIELRQVDSKMEAQATEQEDTEQEDTEQEDTEQEDTEQQNQENKIEEEPLN